MSTTENGGFGGMLRELKLTLNELFSGGKLEPEQELTVQVLFGLLGYLSNVDGIVTDHEVTITGGSSPVAGMVEIHETVRTDSGGMQMQPKAGGVVIRS